jgi:hypothetical protein
MNRVLIVTENDVLIRNMREYFVSHIENGSLILDHAKEQETAEKYLGEYSYDKIFHNGIFIFPIIEKLQAGAQVYNYGKTNNDYYVSPMDPNDMKSFSKIFDKKWFRLGVNIGGYVTAIIAFVIFVGSLASFGYMVNGKADINSVQIEEVKIDVAEIKEDVGDVKDIQGKVKEDVGDLITIMSVVYGDKVRAVLDKKNEK